MGPLLPIEAHRHLVVFEETIFAKIGSAAFEDQLIAKETQTIGGLLLHIEMRPDVEDSEDAPWAAVVDLLNSDEPMGLSDRQIVELLESDDVTLPDAKFQENLKGKLQLNY